MSEWHGSLKSPEGEVFCWVAGPLTPADAQELVAKGALVMIDTCGDGCVGIDWLDDKERKDAAKRGMVLSRRDHGEFQRWESQSGRVAVFVDGGDLRR